MKETGHKPVSFFCSGENHPPFRMSRFPSLRAPLPLADTSALVLLWCGPEIYRSPAVHRYAALLDLSAGRDLLRRCDAVWGHYGRVIEYRKRCILHEAVKAVETGGIRQVVIAGAGFSMLGIELAALVPDLSVFETDADRSSMVEKRRLTAGLSFAAGSTLHCLEADAEDSPGTLSALEGAGWQRDRPTLLVVEGLSYYISKDSLRRQWESLVQGSRVVLEYLVPPADVGEARRPIPERVFGIIMEYCSSEGEYTRWREEELLLESGVQVERVWTMDAIERKLGAGERLFLRREDGWIEIAVMERFPEDFTGIGRDYR